MGKKTSENLQCVGKGDRSCLSFNKQFLSLQSSSLKELLQVIKKSYLYGRSLVRCIA